MIEFGIMLFFAGIILLIGTLAQVAQNHAFREAQKVTGTVIYKHSPQRKNGRAYLLKLSYSVNGIAYEREVGVLGTEYENIEIGGQYEVLYRPDKPKKILRPQNINPKIVEFLLSFSSALLAIGIALVFIGRM